jgi:hypothetical protein
MFRKTTMVGSQTIEGAANASSDYDILALAWSRPYAAKQLTKQGFYSTSTQNLRYGVSSHCGFISMVKGDINYILTSSPKFYNKFQTANSLAVALKLTNKEDRITLFQYILYGRLPTSTAEVDIISKMM